MTLFATRLGHSNLSGFPLGPTTLCLGSEYLLDKRSLAVFVLNTRTVELRGTFDDSTHLRELGCFGLPGLLLVVSMGVEDAAHLAQLQVTLELRCEVRLRQVEPLRPSSSCFLLPTGQTKRSQDVCEDHVEKVECLRVTMKKESHIAGRSHNGALVCIDGNWDNFPHWQVQWKDVYIPRLSSF